MVLRVRGGNAPTQELADDKTTTQTGDEHAADTDKATAAEAGNSDSPQRKEEVVETVDQRAGENDDEKGAQEPEASGKREPVTIDNEPEAEAGAGAAAQASDEHKSAADVAPAGNQQVATRSENTQVSTEVRGAGENYFKQLIEAMAADGQEGLEMGFGVFPVISLDKGEFKVGDEDMGDSSFTGVPLLSKPKFCYRTVGVGDKDAEVIFADSDKEHLDERSAVSAKLLEWKEKWENSSWECKQYQDVFLYMVKCPDKPELEEQLCQLSVAPQSVKLYTRACLQATGRGRKPHECVFEVGVGEKIRGEFDYYPWAFKAIGSCQKLGVTVNFGGTVDEDF